MSILRKKHYEKPLAPEPEAPSYMVKKFFKKMLAFLILLLYNIRCVKELTLAPLAQLEEHLTLNQGVQGSSP